MQMAVDVLNEAMPYLRAVTSDVVVLVVSDLSPNSFSVISSPIGWSRWKYNFGMKYNINNSLFQTFIITFLL